MLLTSLDDEAIDALVAAVGDRNTSPLAIIQIRGLGGAFAEEPALGGAVRTVVEPFNVFALGIPAVPELAEAIPHGFAAVDAAVGHLASGRRMPNFVGARPGRRVRLRPDGAAAAAGDQAAPRPVRRDPQQQARPRALARPIVRRRSGWARAPVGNQNVSDYPFDPSGRARMGREQPGRAEAASTGGLRTRHRVRTRIRPCVVPCRLLRRTHGRLTAALTGAAKVVLASQRKDVRRGRADIDTVWTEMDRYQRFQLLDQLGAQILPVLVALPDIEVATGTRPTYTDRQVRETVEATLSGSEGKLRRAVLLTARTALVQSALRHVPPRSDPDALTVPDHL